MHSSGEHVALWQPLVTRAVFRTTKVYVMQWSRVGKIADLLVAWLLYVLFGGAIIAILYLITTNIDL